MKSQMNKKQSLKKGEKEEKKEVPMGATLPLPTLLKTEEKPPVHLAKSEARIPNQVPEVSRKLEF